MKTVILAVVWSAIIALIFVLSTPADWEAIIGYR